MDYPDYLQSPEWRERRAEVLRFWNGQCALCSWSESVDVHHRTYERLGREHLSDLIPLCRNCHQEFHAHIGLTRRTNPPEMLPAGLEMPSNGRVLTFRPSRSCPCADCLEAFEAWERGQLPYPDHDIFAGAS